MNVKELKQSKFLKKEDVGNGILVTIRKCTQENVALPGTQEDLRWAMHFDETEKPLILNNTNGMVIASICGSEESDEWVGKKIVLYNDPTIQFQGKLVGGVRVRAPRNKPAQAPTPARASVAPKPAPAPAPEPEPEPVDPGPGPEESDVPF